MKRVAAGDATGLRELFDRHTPIMLGIATRLLHDRHAAEDLVNEVFLELWQKAELFTADRGSLRTYLLMLTRSRSIDRIRSDNRKSAGGGHKIGSIQNMSVSDNGDSPPESAERSELRSIVRAEMADLNEQQRQLLDLAFFDGLTHKEIAEHTNQPLGTIKGRLRRTMLVLQDRLRARLNPGELRTSQADGNVVDPNRSEGGGE